MYLLGLDIGSSSVKAALLDGESGSVIAAAYSPKEEMPIASPHPGWAEQDPETWWHHLKIAVKDVVFQSGARPSDILSIGIAYQMHGLVIIDKAGRPLRPAIIWCDGRAVVAGGKAFREIGEERCLQSLLNAPGNFTAAKLKWVLDHEPRLADKIHKALLPGDYIAMKLTGQPLTTISGLSEGVFWDFPQHEPAGFLLKGLGIPEGLLPEAVPAFGHQGQLTAAAASELGLSARTTVSYRAGDQPNNAFSLNVMSPGELAANAGTSGVVYGLSDELKYDPLSRVNTFAHVNHTKASPRVGILLCINGTGIQQAWLRRMLGGGLSYAEMNHLAEAVAPGSEGLAVLPFGNGAERMLGNCDLGASFSGLRFNRHTRGHLARAVQEGIAFAFQYGLEIMQGLGLEAEVVRAGKANMFLSPVFREALSNTTGARVELYNSDGAIGAARGAGVGAGFYHSFEEAFSGLRLLELTEPAPKLTAQYAQAYRHWKQQLENAIQIKQQ
ncbi:xylulokinase [Phaeodactylibacter luteus]|uniref:Carbohydrate kinase n=1 Tax=Phaeodactylibacter luteus TaxID=1564516 RepID=A0A5C6RW08_9BACT|nr:FGGY family carbohydrate kinase [Phaeodactylibacter luteus]TXB65552.1 carbohydrate kinase [Phaeodactylibacter luteus]